MMMSDWGFAEARFVNRSRNQTYCVVGDAKDSAGNRFVRSQVIRPNQEAQGDAVFPCDARARINSNAQGLKATSSGWSGVRLAVDQEGRVTTENKRNPIGLVGAAWHYYKDSQGTTDGSMNFNQFLNKINGGMPINVMDRRGTILHHHKGNR